MLEKYLYLLAFLSLLPLIASDAHAANPNLFVSAENSQFENHFSGSMVVEVVIRDSNIRDTGEGKGEPDVTINGKSLRMVQASDGNWYAYFANADKAMAADSTVGQEGTGLDFGVFCDRDTPVSVFGISLSDSDGFSVPGSGGIAGYTNGQDSFSECSGSVTGSDNMNNVVRNARSINTNSAVPPGQIGLNPDAWPLIQLFSFDKVKILYNPGGSSQQVLLDYDEIPNIAMSIDRDSYPANSEVFLTINDIQLNQDPTDSDSWTFNIGQPESVFYQAFDENGSSSADGSAGLVDLNGYLSSLGFEDNGQLSIDLGSVMELRSNDEQPATSVSDGSRNFSTIVTLVETAPNSGIFDSGDDGNRSSLGILADSPRGQAGSITYNDKSVSVLTGSSTAQITLQEPTLNIRGDAQNLTPGTEFTVVLVDPDQNINSGVRDDLDVFRDTAIIPSMKIGSPVTLEDSSDVRFFPLSTTLVGNSADSSVPDRNSARLFIDTSTIPDREFEKISMNLGISASGLRSVLIDPSSEGTNWLNYDLRSFSNNLGIADFSDTSFELSFGSLGASPVIIAGSGDLAGPSGLVQLDDSDIADKDGAVFLVINFDSSDDSASVGTIPNDDHLHPIIVDLFSFGFDGSDSINNSIYRFELEETEDDSSTFEGNFEYSVASNLNALDPEFIQTIKTIGDEIKFVVLDQLTDEEGITISYSDIDAVGVATLTSSQSDITTSSGIVMSDSKSYRFGQPVTITVNDPDLNLRNDTVDIYFVNNDPDSPNVDTVGDGGAILLEVLIKDIRYMRCTIDGIEYGGLGATGFTLAETGPSTGIFEGLFKMPSQICNKSGTELIYAAGGSLDAKYYDSRDGSGNANTFTLLRSESITDYHTFPSLSPSEIIRPLSGTAEIILSGNIDNHTRGVPLTVSITGPDGKSQSFAAILSNGGNYKSAILIDKDSPIGVYRIELSHAGSDLGDILFTVISPELPAWLKSTAAWWSSDSISDSTFVAAIDFLIHKGVILLPDTAPEPTPEGDIPYWLKTNAKQWSEDQISDYEFLESLQYLLKTGTIRI